MGVLCMIIGTSGSGKSTSLRNFENNEVGIFNVAGKPLPFQNHLQKADRPGYRAISESLRKNACHCYVIDDSTYLMQFEMFQHAKESGYTKFTDMAFNFEQLLEVAADTDEDTTVYFLHHPQFAEDGKAKPQTVGKMLDNQLNVEGLFPIVIEATVQDGKHVFVTENNGANIAKTPMGMLPPVMDNDLKAVDDAIRAYWGMAPLGKTVAPKKPTTTTTEGDN